MAKVRVPVPLDGVYRRLIGNWFSCSTSRDDGVLQRCINELLRFYPEERRELCNSASCHRCTLRSGRRRERRQPESGDAPADRPLLRRRQHDPATTPHEAGVRGPRHDQRPALRAPHDRAQRAPPHGRARHMFVGGDNAVLSTEATERTYETLCEAFGRHGGGDDGVMYRRRIVPGYGHLDCWMGRQAWEGRLSPRQGGDRPRCLRVRGTGSRSRMIGSPPWLRTETCCISVNVLFNRTLFYISLHL